jgi:RNase P/RNase MRP subunit p30
MQACKEMKNKTDEREYYDLCLRTADSSILRQAASYGWTGVCVSEEIEKAQKLREAVPLIKNLECYTGAIISKDVEKNARKALEFADLVIVSGGDDEVNREASECWEVDILLHPEANQEKDFMDYRNAGLDHVMASYMAKRGIALGIDYSRLLSSTGRSLAQLIGRIRQNARIALKYKVPVVLVSCASDRLSVRSPWDLAAVANPLLGIPEHVAVKAVSGFPGYIIKKMKDRKNPNVILKGLEVTDWGGQKPAEKKRTYGWY